MAAPIPREPPVTKATLLDNFDMKFLLVYKQQAIISRYMHLILVRSILHNT